MLLRKAEATLNEVDKELHGCNFREALRRAMSLAQEANRYLDVQSPWKVIKEKPDVAAMSTYTVLSVLSALKTVLYPFLPFSSEKLHALLGFTGSVQEVGWKIESLPPGQKILQPQPLFVKLDDSIIEQETNRIGNVSY